MGEPDKPYFVRTVVMNEIILFLGLDKIRRFRHDR